MSSVRQSVQDPPVNRTVVDLVQFSEALRHYSKELAGDESHARAISKAIRTNDSCTLRACWWFLESCFGVSHSVAYQAANLVSDPDLRRDLDALGERFRATLSGPAVDEACRLNRTGSRESWARSHPAAAKELAFALLSLAERAGMIAEDLPALADRVYGHALQVANAQAPRRSLRGWASDAIDSSAPGGRATVATGGGTASSSRSRSSGRDWEAVAISILFASSQPPSITEVHERLKAEGYSGSRPSLYNMAKFVTAAAAAGVYRSRSDSDRVRHRGMKTKDGRLEAYHHDEQDTA